MLLPRLKGYNCQPHTYLPTLTIKKPLMLLPGMKGYDRQPRPIEYDDGGQIS
jgi:hypothetical protein